jgi:hypothetical protein
MQADTRGPGYSRIGVHRCPPATVVKSGSKSGFLESTTDDAAQEEKPQARRPSAAFHAAQGFCDRYCSRTPNDANAATSFGKNLNILSRLVIAKIFFNSGLSPQSTTSPLIPAAFL